MARLDILLDRQPLTAAVTLTPGDLAVLAASWQVRSRDCRVAGSRAAIELVITVDDDGPVGEPDPTAAWRRRLPLSRDWRRRESGVLYDSPPPQEGGENAPVTGTRTAAEDDLSSRPKRRPCAAPST